MKCFKCHGHGVKFKPYVDSFHGIYNMIQEKCKCNNGKITFWEWITRKIKEKVDK
jgi:hypothetical protein